MAIRGPAYPVRQPVAPSDADPVGENHQADVALQADAPKDRMVLGDHNVLTDEFDVTDPEFLALQLPWLRPRKNPLDCRMGDLYRYCSQYVDLAIHVVFATFRAGAVWVR